ncbi:MAG: hypothetical protein QOG21_422 [Actinomycetota bacterium]|jgi:hypothetical protein|nr:hypothetical protein [Actinomycetota bacterium]
MSLPSMSSGSSMPTTGLDRGHNPLPGPPKPPSARFSVHLRSAPAVECRPTRRSRAGRVSMRGNHGSRVVLESYSGTWPSSHQRYQDRNGQCDRDHDEHYPEDCVAFSPSRVVPRAHAWSFVAGQESQFGGRPCEPADFSRIRRDARPPHGPRDESSSVAHPHIARSGCSGPYVEPARRQ